LFWHIPDNKKKDISHALLVETILNYGDWEAVKEMIRILGMENTAAIFFDSINASDRKKGNYHELTVHYFTIFFSRNAQGNPS